MAEIQFRLDPSEDGASAMFIVSFDGRDIAHASMLTRDVEGLIEQLAVTRAGMTPAVPSGPQGARVGHIPDPAFYIRIAEPSEEIELLLRHPGLGWISFEIPRSEASEMKSILERLLDAPRQSQGRAN
jgi:hypothetical protein